MSSDPITIILMGEPVPFARMRLSRSTGGHYIPAEQRNAMAALRIAAGDAMRQQGAVLFDEPVTLDLLAEFPIPMSWSRKKRSAALLGAVRPGKRPDIDNLYKLAADALNSVVFRDDALIVEMHARKIYGGQPKLVITVQPAANRTLPTLAA
jgi:Holliday junction resolvase RusA-like endonuclease